MKIKLKQLLLATAALAVLALVPAAVKADSVTVNGDLSITIAQGGMGTLNGIVTNGGTPRIYLDSISASGGAAGIFFDGSPFIANTPPFLDPGQSTALVGFLDISVGMSVAPNTYVASFTVLGGDSPGAQNVLGTHQFTIIVQGAQTAVPEPATMFLLATGLGGAALARRRVKRKEKIETRS